MRSGLPRMSRRTNLLYFSPLTVGFSLYIIISACFMQQLWCFLSKNLGEDNLRWLCIHLYIFTGIIILLYTFKSRLSPLKCIGAVILLIITFLFSWTQPYFVEKLHVLEYGILGWLTMRDFNWRIGKGTFEMISLSFLFVLVVSCLDEGLQKLLPYRVGEIRDIMTNMISGISGIVLFSLNK